MKNTNISTSRAFTLIEAMVAVTILTLSIAGPLYSASRAIIAAQSARDQLIASHLAQEGIEYVRAMRDDAYLSAYPGGTSAAWDNFKALISSCGTSCQFDPAISSLTACSGSSCIPLYLAPTHIYTQQTGGTVTPFTRIIRVSATSAIDEMIESTVSWNFHGIPFSVTIIDHLTSWQ
ncbi:MAG: prepilin-type N-terminal cleavage/methylation domain-containing protein [Candidatus Paceibacterota bacterium]|jgi:Tfp pilus assembly protein PilV